MTTNEGRYSRIASSFDYDEISESGDYSQLSASGDNSEMEASGYYSRLAASGDGCRLAASGDFSIVMSAGYRSTASAGMGGVIALAWYGDYRPRVSVAYVGENGIKPNVYYRLNDAGEFVEVKQND